MKRIQIFFLHIVILSTIVTSSCKKFVQKALPANVITAGSVYANNSGATSVLNGIYINIGSGENLVAGQSSIGYYTGLLSDELKLYTQGTDWQLYYENNLDAQTSPSFFRRIYQQLHIVNEAIDGINNSKGITAGEKSQLIGEAKFLRAFFLHYATLCYGEIPIVTSADYQVTSHLHQSPVSDVYNQIITDLKDAQNLLPENYVDAQGNTVSDRVRPNKLAATALLARVYLYNSNWSGAIKESSYLIQDAQLNLETDLNNVFSTTSKEAIWQFQNIDPSYETLDGFRYVLISDPGTGDQAVALSSFLTNAFENGDNRFTSWVGTFNSSTGTYYYANKYKVGVYTPAVPITEYTTVFRLAEQHLIRAEAYVKNHDTADALLDLNKIRHRAGLPDYSGSTDDQSLLDAILHERQVELFTEWGHRWFDLKRTGKIDAVMSSVAPTKNATWESYKALLPISQDEITADHNLHQTPGYH
ncbi:MAG: RagB/SusD family nutrient uptake outer membrane protein [Mucilaginibacter sp.]|nr:RagB/SusD family nutrient uptake outer membrane protein [Mucilaginibacter sp.]